MEKNYYAVIINADGDELAAFSNEQARNNFVTQNNCVDFAAFPVTKEQAVYIFKRDMELHRMGYAQVTTTKGDNRPYEIILCDYYKRYDQ